MRDILLKKLEAALEEGNYLEAALVVCEMEALEGEEL
jgi:hypothetical protein